MSSYAELYQLAAAHHGGDQALEKLLSKPKSARALKAVGDDRYLAEMCACIFRSGFVWRVIQQKWDGFETVFNGFLPLWVASRSPEQIDSMASDARIVRNRTKVLAVIDNARLVLDINREHGSVGKFLADWPATDITGLWAYLKKNGSRLGGNSGAYFLRFSGKDTFIMSRDVCRVLLNQGVIQKENPTSRRDLDAAQAFFNGLQEQSGRSMQELSRITAMSIGPDQ